MEAMLFRDRFFINKNSNDLVDELKRKKFTNRNILNCIKKIPRELFVKKEFSNHCYENIPLSADCNQTISQPFVVAFMIHCLKLKKNDRILEVGTGTGYQTVILANLCKYVYTIEKFQELLDQAKINHKKLKLKNINYMLGNGADGWNKPVLFDAIIVSASVEKISSKLLENLKDKGRLIFPKKYSFGKQKLLLLKKISNSKYTSQKLFDVEFVPLL